MDIKFLSKRDLEEVLDISKVIEGVIACLKASATHQTEDWQPVLHRFGNNGLVEIHSGGIPGDIAVHGTNIHSTFPGNVKQQLPENSGLLMVFDSNTGMPLGVLNAAPITSMRKGAVAGVGTALFARPGASTLTILGTDHNTPYVVAAVLTLLPKLRRIILVDSRDPQGARELAGNLPSKLADEFSLWTTSVRFEVMDNMSDAADESDCIIVQGQLYALDNVLIRPGTHITSISDAVDPGEILSADIIHSGSIFSDRVGKVLARQIPGRTTMEEITIFNAPDLAALDIVTARIAISAAFNKAKGSTVEL